MIVTDRRRFLFQIRLDPPPQRTDAFALQRILHISWLEQRHFCFDLDLLSCDCSRLVAGPDDMMRPSCGTIATTPSQFGRNSGISRKEREREITGIERLTASIYLPCFPILRLSLISSNSSARVSRHTYCRNRLVFQKNAPRA